MDESRGHKLVRALLSVRRGLERASGFGGLSQGEYLALRRIKMERGGQSGGFRLFKAVRISEYLSMPPPAVSRILNSLESKGLAERRINADNRRSVIIELTEKGEGVLRESERSIGEFADGLIAELGEEEAERLTEMLERVADYCGSRAGGDYE